MNPRDDLLTYAEAAAVLGKKPRTVERWVRDGVIAAIKVGASRRIERRELDDYFARRRAEANRERAAAAKARKRGAAA
ncbi:helix-turn-helix domain-containing protein [Pseudonocardia acaciae]|uniref:helix-turn-helix domain-containing protein n=1 Tax=Pseudonocardia acaciae TaxID=551276 RepID=UPI0004901AAC|nr:helix-turn-helix domain-containing protein [Pseudonocardia acaciae]